ncbi:cytochrome C5 [Leifsonia sp. NPDC058194]|uniref:cytochrome C5 n=1 Tax=Leifsonia sp. NPDC058194 TaxID=3346374 RepID=UPI0036DBCFF4
MDTSLDTLKDELSRRGLITAPEIEGSFVYGPAHFSAVGGEVMLNVDPEIEEREAPDVGGLCEKVGRLLALSATAWREVIEAAASEIEEAVGPEPIAEPTDLRDDLELKSMVVFVDAVLLSFDAPRQFPDSVIRVLLDEDLVFDDVEVDERDDDHGDVLTFGSLDELLDHLSSGASSTADEKNRSDDSGTGTTV